MSFDPLSSEILYEGPAFSVRRTRLTLPNGKSKAFDAVIHSGAVTIVPVDAAGNIYFVRQYRIGVGGELLELPAGTLEPNEDPAYCAGREIREETGFAAGSLEKLGEFYLAPGYSTEYMHVYLATHLTHSPLPGDDDEFLQLVSIPAAEAYAMAVDGRLPDGKTLAALLLARPHLSAWLNP